MWTRLLKGQMIPGRKKLMKKLDEIMDASNYPVDNF